ncbi:HAD family hydrolase [Kitasatospora sp. KL5]|uniref:HAD family hydrolase n=1 Tax=Kitasatospora sp. KL5 TaxID=3425125 RepID=UPI003D6DB30E
MNRTLPAIGTVAIDVGGILYYDEPFELIWLQGVLERAGDTDPTLTIEQFTAEMRRFYLQRTRAATSPGLYSPAGTESWRHVRHTWTDHVQVIPGALDALSAIAADRPVCVVANQPPECENALRDIGAVDHLALVALDALVGIAKPNPALLQWALGQLGWKAVTTLVIGDRPDHDAAPAQLVGAHAALVALPTGWSVPSSIDPALAAAYEVVRVERHAIRQHPAADHSLHGRDLADLATALTTQPRHSNAKEAIR